MITKQRLLWISGLALASLILFTGCPGAGVQPPSPRKIILFGTERLYTGDLGGRSGADTKVQNDSARPEGLTKVHAFLSVDSDDCLQNFPERYGFSRDLPIFGPDGTTKVADNWADLLDGNIQAHLFSLGVLNPVKGEAWWSGSNPDGSAAPHTCNGWRDGSGTQRGIAGSADFSGGEWINIDHQESDPDRIGTLSDMELQLIGVGLSAEAPGHYVAAEGLSLNETAVTMTVGESFQLEAQIEPADATTRDINWKVSNTGPGVARLTVSEGEVTALATTSQNSTPEVVAFIETPEGERLEARCAVTIIPRHIVLFATSEPHSSDIEDDGDFPTDEVYPNLASLLYNDPGKPDGYSNYEPLAAVDGKGIDQYPQDYADRNFSADVPVVGPGPEYRLIADNWADLLDGTIKLSLVDAGVLEPGPNTVWWSGLEADGTPDTADNGSANNAGNWNQATSSDFNARVGVGTDTGSSWVKAYRVTSDIRHYFLGVAW